ncbi:glycoside hydrolase family 57 protein [Hydrogenimonas urashimensis]|uniref:glycoside hydrolase family 57 protein n=1 Tax=Hydrogenimonas urashimensis TaxID=2740515 RepID=UPI00191581DC|nr:glycoside hydrolase family 57 protein [Hydrogenimonas urashimensis]
MALSLSIFWHMHQPDYRNAEGKMGMPWVFLHAIKDYYEMPWLLSRYPSLKATFNITPPLIEQLRLYIQNGIECDLFLTLWSKEPRDLSSDERAYVMKICNSTQFDTMVKPFHRYVELFKRDDLNDIEFIELEVLFMLAWCGNYLRHNDATVDRLLKKGSGYTSADKRELLETLMRFLPTILPFYRSLMEKGQISLATTPFNHPILPLLIDMSNAQRSNPKTKIPPNHFPMVDDAKEQVRRAIALYEEVFGCRPTGFWPAEGAVDEKSAEIYKDNGVQWIATDEAILFKSIGSDNRDELYRRYAFNDLFIAFRDHGLSDLIGFTYRFWEGDRAAGDFLDHLRKIDEKGENAAVSVILDGENAWEFYPNNAFDFFDALYRKLSQTPWCSTVTMDELARTHERRLETLHPGSWIYGTFDTWVGHPEKNAAWELIYQTKSDYLNHRQRLQEDVRKKITDHFLAAECSDWFWWYGEDHYTDYSEEFDALFRSHLIEIYSLMDVPPPAVLFKPITGDKKNLHALVNEPKFPIHPTIDGRVTSFFEWLGSGMIDESRLFSTMDKVRGPITKIYWGEDIDTLYIRLDGEMERLKKSGTIRIYVKGLERSIDIDLRNPPKEGGLVTAAIDRIVEIGIRKRLHFHDMESIRLRLEVLVDREVVQVLPGVSELVVDLNEDYSEHWFV